MKIDELREAGFSDDEISAYVNKKRDEWLKAGFSTEEINKHLGTQEPQFDADAFKRQLPPFSFAEQYYGMLTDIPEEDVAQARRDMETLVWDGAKHLEGMGYSAAAAVNKYVGLFSEHLGAIHEYMKEKKQQMRDLVGIKTLQIEDDIDDPKMWLRIAQTYEENRQYWQARADKIGLNAFEELISEAIGGAIPGIAEFMLNIPYAGVLGAAEARKAGENEFVGFAMGAMKRGILGKILHAIQPLKQYLRAPTMGTVFGLDAYFSGAEPKEVAKAVGTGMIYSLMSPGGNMGLGEVREGLKTYLYRTEANQPGDARYEEFKKSVEQEVKEGFKPEKGFEKEELGAAGTPAGEPIRRSDIVRFLMEKLDVPIRVGHFRDKALGIFKIGPGVVRSKTANDIRVISHEIGHAIQKFLFPESVGRRGFESIFGAFADELVPIASQPRTGRPASPEGFAEFIRYYVTDAPAARQKCPRFYQHFEHVLDQKCPEVKNILLSARDQYKRWKEQPDEYHILSGLSIGESGHGPGVRFKDIYRGGMDEMIFLDDIVKEMVGKKGEKALRVADNPYKLARLLRGISGKVETFIFHRPFNFFTYKDVGKSFKDIIKPVEKNMNDLRIYMVSKHAKEVMDRGLKTQFDKDVVDRMIEKYKGKYEPIMKEISEYQDHVLQYFLDAGMLTAEQGHRFKKCNKAYVPFYRVHEMAGPEGTGKGLEVYGLIKKMKGDTRDIIDPIESIMKNTASMIMMAEKNAINQKLVKLAKTHSDMGKYVEEIPAPLQKITVREPELHAILDKYGKWATRSYRTVEEKVTEKVTVGGKEVAQAPASKVEEKAREALMNRGWSAAETDQILNRIKNAPGTEGQAKVIEKTIERTVSNQTIREFGVEIPHEFIELFRPSSLRPSGDIISVFWKGKQKFYQVHPDIAKTIRGLDIESASIWVSLASIPARWLRAGATLTPEFMSRNPFRDQFSAFIYSKYGFVPGLDFMRGIAHIARKDEMYWDWKKSGGENATIVSVDRDYLQQKLGDILQGSPLKRVIKNPIEALRILSELGEEATRIGEFAKGMKKETGKGLTKKEAAQQAGFASREVTLDFGRIGAYTRSVNMIIAFWNANVQGTDKMVRAFKEDPVKTSMKIMAAITLPSILTAIATHDDERMKEIPQWQKDLFWVFPVGDTIVRFPKPFELGVIFGSVPERFVHYIMDRDPHAFDEVLNSISRGISPGFIPTAALPFIENWANKSMFFDRAIVPRGKEELPEQYQYQEYTTEVAKRLGKIFAAMPGTEWLGLTSPAKIENVIRGWNGGLGVYAMQLLSIPLKRGVEGEGPGEKPTGTFADIPYVKAFIVRYPSTDTQSIHRFYQNYERANAKIRAARELMVREFRFTEGEELLNETELRLDGMKEALSNMHLVVDQIYHHPDMSGDDKRQLIDELYLQMLEIARAGNEAVDAFNKEMKEME